MEKEKRAQKKRMPQSFTQILTVCVAVVLCALIYAFIGRDGKQEASITIGERTAAPTATPTPVPTPPKGIRPAVMLDRLEQTEVVLELGEDGIHSLSHGEGGEKDMLRFSLQEGYVRGFTLQMEGVERPEINEKSPTEIEKRLLSTYHARTLAQDERLEALLPVLLDALVPEGYFPPATALAWAGLVAGARESGDVVREAEHGYLFTASFRRDGSLTLAVGAE